jgi:hypothetical protein
VVNLLVAIPISRWGPRPDNRRATLIVGILGAVILAVGTAILVG